MLRLRLRGFLTAAIALAVLAVALGYAAAAFSPSSMLPGGDWRFRRSLEPVVALTFDDGPDGQFTLPIAEMLRASGANATFFFMGQRIAEHPEVARRVAELGFELGNHSYDHPDMAQMTPAQMEWQLDETNRLLADTAGAHGRFFRPPYGSFDDRMVAAVQARGMTMVLWSVDSRDWADPQPESIAARVLAGVRPGAVILMHSTHPQSLAALPGILDGLAARGYRMESVSGWLAALQEPPAPPPRPRLVEGPVLPPPGRVSAEIPVATVGERTEQPAETEVAEVKYRVISNIASLEALYQRFVTALLIPRAETPMATRLSHIAWQRDLPARSPELYDRDFLQNNRVYAATYYPQPRFYLLLRREQMTELDAELVRRLVHEGGICETLIVAEDSAKRIAGDFGVPARFIGAADYDAGAVFSLGRDSLPQLVDLFRRKKAAVFVTVEPVEAEEIDAEKLPATLVDFLRFRQLTNDRVFDPGRDLRESLQLPEGVDLVRFSGSGRTMLMLLAREDAAMSVPRKLRKFMRVSLLPDAVAEAEPLGRTLELVRGATYLLSD